MTEQQPRPEREGRSRRQALLYILLGMALAWGIAIGVGALDDTTTDDWIITEGAVIDADDGPQVELGTDLTVDRRYPIPGDGSVDLRPEIGITGPDGTAVRYDGTQGDGLVRIEEMTLAGETTFLHESEGGISVSGSADGIEWRDPDTTSANTDLRYHSGALSVEIASSQALYVTDAETGEVITAAEENDGTVSFDLDSTDSSWRSISLVESEGAPVIDVDSADPAGPQDDDPAALSVNITDPDNSSVDVEFEHNGESVGTDTVSGSGTASTSTGETVMGGNQWTVTATNQLGQTETETFDFQVPDELRIYNESDTDSLIETDTSVEVTFFGDDQAYTRTTTDGTVSLEGLPVDQEFTVQVDADGYLTRQTIIRSIYEQQAVYALPDDAETVSTRFELEDPTGQFDPSNTRILIKKPVTRDGVTSYETVVGDIMGAGGFSTTLEQDQRYLIEVENIETGTSRTLGPYVASVPETVILEVDQISFTFENEEAGYQWGAEYRNESGQRGVDFHFVAENGIDELDVMVTERGGNQTVLLEDSWTDETEIQERIVIPGSVPESSSVTVEWTATVRNSDGNPVEVSGSVTVGPDGKEVHPEGVSDRVLELVAIFVVLLVAGLFSAANVGVGGVVTSLTAGLFWFVGFLPGAVSGMMIGLALLLSVLWLVRNSRGPQ